MTKSSTAARDSVARLVGRMNSVTPLSERDVERIREGRKIDFFDRAGSAAQIERRRRDEKEPLSHFALPEAEKNDFMARTKQDLGAQVKIVGDSFEHWLKTGMIPAPYYANRVAILRKDKRPDLEADFLRAWLRHFPGGPGARYGALAERAQKMGIEADQRPPPRKVAERVHKMGIEAEQSPLAAEGGGAGWLRRWLSRG